MDALRVAALPLLGLFPDALTRSFPLEEHRAWSRARGTTATRETVARIVAMLFVETIVSLP
mgnify:FL=1|jgi:hypothetical protein|tara:strand:+ start:229 stop:411 length:183 start_codon:yes stop_codon:yes gene_type:complete